MAASSEKELRVLLAKDVFDWTVADVGLWLNSIGLGHLRQAFIENMVSGISLLELDDDDLKSLNVLKIGDRKTFLRSLRRLIHSPNETSAGQTSSASSRSDDASGADEDDSWDTDSQRSGSSVRSSGSQRSSKSDKSKSSARRRRHDRGFDKHQIKAYYSERAKVFEVPRDESLTELRARIRKLHHHRMKIYWKDDDGDKIELKRQADWSLCKKSSGQRIRLWCKRAASEDSRKRQAEFKAITSMSDPVVTSDEQGFILALNPAAEAFFGYRAAQLLGSKVNMLMPDDVSAVHDQYIRRYLDTGDKQVIGVGRRVTAQKRSGESAPVYLTLAEQWNRKRTERKFVATFQDMSQQQDASAVITDDLTAQFAILQGLIDIVVVINDKGIIKYINSAAEDFFGVRAQHTTGKNVKMFMQGKDKREHDAYLERYKATGRSTIIGRGRDVVVALADGTLRSVHLTVTEQKFGAASLFTGVMRPLEEAKETPESPVSVIEQLREVLDSLLVAAVVADDHGHILAFNESAEELFGYRFVEVVNRNVSLLCPPEHAAHHDLYMQKWRDTGEEHIFGLGRNMTARTKSGQIIPVRLSVSKKPDENGKYLLTATFQRLD